MRAELSYEMVRKICEVYEFGTKEYRKKVEELMKDSGRTPEEAKSSANMIISDEAEATWDQVFMAQEHIKRLKKQL